MTRPKNRRADEKLLAALACGATKENAARQAGVSLSTVKRRLDDPEFCRQLQALRADILHRAIAALTAASTEAVRTLLDLLKPSSPHAARLGAARSVLEIGMKARLLVELEERMTALEKQSGLEPLP